MSYQQPPGYMSYQQEYEVPEDEDDTCELELPSPLDLAHQVGVEGSNMLLEQGSGIGKNSVWFVMSYQQEYDVPEDEDGTCELELPSQLDLAHQVGFRFFHCSLVQVRVF
jgi:hypothetical protein